MKLATVESFSVRILEDGETYPISPFNISPQPDEFRITDLSVLEWRQTNLPKRQTFLPEELGLIAVVIDDKIWLQEAVEVLFKGWFNLSPCHFLIEENTKLSFKAFNCEATLAVKCLVYRGLK